MTAAVVRRAGIRECALQLLIGEDPPSDLTSLIALVADASVRAVCAGNNPFTDAYFPAKSLHNRASEVFRLLETQPGLASSHMAQFHDFVGQAAAGRTSAFSPRFLLFF